TARSSSGVSCLHGPHHGAQKSTITGVCTEASSTSATNVVTDESLIHWPLPLDAGAAPAVPADFPAVESLLLSGRPVGSINDAMGAYVLLPAENMGLWARKVPLSLSLVEGPRSCPRWDHSFSGSRITSGSCPIARRNRTRSAAFIAVVRSFRSG